MLLLWCVVLTELEYEDSRNPCHDEFINILRKMRKEAGDGVKRVKVEERPVQF